MKKLLFTALLASSLSVAVADTYTIDPHHTNARFAADHNGTSTNVGGFFLLEGKVEFDAAKKTGSVDIKIPMSKMNNGNAEFDEHLKAENFFNAQKFPEMRFVSKNTCFFAFSMI